MTRADDTKKVGQKKATRKESKRERRRANGQNKTVSVDRLYYLQPDCSSAFKCGTSVASVITGLQTGRVDPKEEWLRLRVIPRGRKTGYYTLDHRRLYSLRQAGVDHVSVKVKKAPRLMREFLTKAHHRLGNSSSIICKQPKDGNCLMHCIKQQVEYSYSIQESIEDVRAAIVAHLTHEEGPEEMGWKIGRWFPGHGMGGLFRSSGMPRNMVHMAGD